jgi:hypothetical protein
MLTQKQNQIIDEIKQEFESHNELINSRKQTSSLLNLESIISDIQERDNLIEEMMVINLSNYGAIRVKVEEEIELLNRELKVLGFEAELFFKQNPKGSIRHWNVYLSKINAQKNAEESFMSMEVNIEVSDLYFKGKPVDDIVKILPKYKWGYGMYTSEDVISLMKSETIREHLAKYWERFNK